MTIGQYSSRDLTRLHIHGNCPGSTLIGQSNRESIALDFDERGLPINIPKGMKLCGVCRLMQVQSRIPVDKSRWGTFWYDKRG